MAYAPAYPAQRSNNRFSDEMFSLPWPQNPEPKPATEAPAMHSCPYCDQPLPHTRSSILSVLYGGVCRLIAAICMILGGIIRFIRVTVAACLCLIGFVGVCCRSLGIRIAHPDDRRFFVRPQTARR